MSTEMTANTYRVWFKIQPGTDMFGAIKHVCDLVIEHTKQSPKLIVAELVEDLSSETAWHFEFETIADRQMIDSMGFDLVSKVYEHD
jgi:hypothetical protein